MRSFVFLSLFSTSWAETYRHCWDGGDQRVDEYRRRLAVVLRSWVWLGVRFVKAEEALDVHGERVRVLKVVRQQNGPCHDDQLEIKHIGSSFRTASGERKRVGEKQENMYKKKERKSSFSRQR